MKLFIILLIILILIVIITLLYYNNKENFSNNEIYLDRDIENNEIYLDRDIENREKWIKEYINNTKDKKDEINYFIPLLTKKLNNIFYSEEFSNIINEHNNTIYKKKIIFIIKIIELELNKLYTSNEIENIYFNGNKLIKILEDYLRCNYKSLNKKISDSDLDYEEEENSTECINNKLSKFIERPERSHLNLDKSNQNYDVDEYEIKTDIHLIYQYFINKNTESLIHIFRNKLIKFYIYEADDYKPQYSLPCIFYNGDLCKSNKNCELLDDITDSDAIKCVPKYNENRKINNNPIKDCNSLSIYGSKVLCERTENLKGQECKWNKDMLKCLNSEDESKVIECEDLRGLDNEDLEKKCANHNKDDNNKSECQYLAPSNDGEDHGLCYNNKIKSKNKMTCLNLSDPNTDVKDEYIKKFGCDTKTNTNTNYYIDKNNGNDYMDNLDCGTFDNSDYILDENGYYTKKDKDNKYLGTDIDRQKVLCDTIQKKNGSEKTEKCTFIERKEPLSGKTITKCIPKTNKYDLVSSDKYTNNCNDIKNEQICDLRKKTCIWLNGTEDPSKGYCINQEFSEFENLIDYYHKEEITNTAKFINLEHEFNDYKTGTIENVNFENESDIKGIKHHADNYIKKRLKEKYPNI